MLFNALFGSQIVDLLDSMVTVNINVAYDDTTVGIGMIRLISDGFDVKASVFAIKQAVNAMCFMTKHNVTVS